MDILEKNVVRKDAWDKVTGQAKYTGDFYSNNMLFARIVTSTISHGNIKSIDTSIAEKLEGVKKIITGQDVQVLCGVLIKDRPALAINKIRYYGEPLAIVIATTEAIAEDATKLIKIQYEKLPSISSPTNSILPDAPIIHENSSNYISLVNDVKPINGTNIASSFKIRKGDINKGFSSSKYIVSKSFSLPKSAHMATEIRICDAEIKADGTVKITTSSQSPFTVKKLLANYFDIEEGKIVVNVPYVGGGFGGKSAVFLEILSYIASNAVNGKKVRLTLSREQDFVTAPSRLGLDTEIKIGANSDGIIQAAEMRFLVDSGAYSDISPNMSKAIAVDCSGPYNIENLSCDSLCVYTNHGYSTAYRGFAHESYTFCLERTIDELAKKCNIDPLQFRLKNAIKPGDFSPSQVEISLSNAGNISLCFEKLKKLINWDEGQKINIGNNKIRAKGLSGFWKTPNPPSNASSGTIITFNSDGSLNLIVGTVEIGTAGKSQLAQMLAQKLNMDYNRIYITQDVNTRSIPEYWKTVASLTSYLAGRAVLNAADDLINQLKENASIALRCTVDDLDIGEEKVYMKHNPKFCIGFKDIAFGLKYPDGNVVGKQIIGRGSFIINHISTLAEDNGKGKVGHSWTVGAQAVEIELDLTEYTYRITKAATVIDIGKVIDPKTTTSIIKGGMSMGIGLATREQYLYTPDCVLLNSSLRTYKMLHIGQEPEYLVDFVETPQIDAPYGTRAYTEHGIIGIPAALVNALSTATGKEFSTIPITPEKIWEWEKNDTN